jgi:hypothetical protein
VPSFRINFNGFIIDCFVELGETAFILSSSLSIVNFSFISSSDTSSTSFSSSLSSSKPQFTNYSLTISRACLAFFLSWYSPFTKRIIHFFFRTLDLSQHDLMIIKKKYCCKCRVIPSFRPRFAGKCASAVKDLTQLTRCYISRLNRLLITPDHHVRTHT